MCISLLISFDTSAKRDNSLRTIKDYQISMINKLLRRLRLCKSVETLLNQVFRAIYMYLYFK